MAQRVVFVSGPYRAPTEWQVLQNIRRAEEVALAAWHAGAAVICPHKNTAHFGGAAEDRIWLDGDLTILRRCDAVVCVEGWERSVGARAEVNCARSLGIPVFESIAGLKEWLNSHP